MTARTHHGRAFLKPLVLGGAVALLALLVGVLWNVPGGMAAGNVITAPDTGGNVGPFTSLALDGSGNPVVSYQDVTNRDLKVLHCNDPNCSGGDESITSPDTGGNVGSHTSLVLDFSVNPVGIPVVSYFDSTNGDLKLMHCNDPNCFGGDESIEAVDTAGNVGTYTSLALDASGNPVVSYRDGTNSALKLAHCSDPNCTAGNSIVTVDTAGNAGFYTSLALDFSVNPDGIPVISYVDRTPNFDLKLAHCGDPNCTAGNSIVGVDTAGEIAITTSLALDISGNPVISYRDDLGHVLKVAHCNDANCSGGDESIVVVDGAGIVGSQSSLQLDASGNPVISYFLNNFAMKVAHCGNANCTAGNTIIAVDPSGSVGTFTSLELDASGNPVVSYYDSANDDLKLAHCVDPSCVEPPPTPGGPTFIVDSTGDGGDSNTADGVCDDGTGECTLRAAIEQANAPAGAEIINFNIGGGGVQTIAPGSALPTITSPIIIDGTTQPGFAGSPIIELDGGGAGTSGNGLTITAGNSTVKGLVINRFLGIGQPRGSGIKLENLGGNTIEGNYIGTDVTGTVALGNQRGLFIDASNNTIGGTTAAARNVISGNTRDEVRISAFTTDATGNVVQGNYIGTDATGMAALGSDSNGVILISGASDTTIGGTTAGARNIISGNNTAVFLLGATGTMVQGNYIGTDVTGGAPLGNRSGVFLASGSDGNTIGGTTAAARNIISDNGFSGVLIAGSSGNVVQGNYIGTDVTGTADLGNEGNGGVVLASASNTTIGGTASGAGNIISGNRLGVIISGSGSTGNLLQGNYIGTDVTGIADLGNDTAGVWILRAPNNNTIGGTASGAGNIIAFSGIDGVLVDDDTSTANAILSNSIFSNDVLGIDLSALNNNFPSGDGVTPNDAGDGDIGGNNLQNYPVLTSVVSGSTNIEGSLNSTANTEFRLEFFANTACDPSGNGEGETFLGFDTVTTDGTGNVSFSVFLSTTVAVGQFITATATDPAGNTSEFSECVSVTADSDGDGILDADDNCPDDPNPDQSDLDSQDGGDVCDPCPSDATDMCDPGRSTGGTIGPGGGTLTTPDGSTAVTIPPGCVTTDTSVSITGGTGTDFELSTDRGDATALFSVNVQPAGLTCDNAEPFTIVFTWDDVAPNDDFVDGTSPPIFEDNLRITKNNQVLFDQLTCRTSHDGDGNPLTLSISQPSCDHAANTFTFQVTSFSDFAPVAPVDTDGDDVPDDFDGVVDNCPGDANPGQENNDGDALGDVCDPDDDNDGVLDVDDNCVFEDSTGFDADNDGCIDSIQGLSVLIDTLLAEGLIDSTMQTSLHVKIDAALASLDRDRVCAAIRQLNALKAHIGGLPDETVSEDVSLVLLQYITNVQTFLVIASGVSSCPGGMP